MREKPTKIEVKLVTLRQPRYSKEEFAERGDRVYETQVRAQVEEGNYGEIVARSYSICWKIWNWA